MDQPQRDLRRHRYNPMLHDQAFGRRGSDEPNATIQDAYLLYVGERVQLNGMARPVETDLTCGIYSASDTLHPHDIPLRDFVDSSRAILVLWGQKCT